MSGCWIKSGPGYERVAASSAVAAGAAPIAVLVEPTTDGRHNASMYYETPDGDWRQLVITYRYADTVDGAVTQLAEELEHETEIERELDLMEESK